MARFGVFSAALILSLSSVFFALSFIGIQKCLTHIWSSTLKGKEAISISMRCVSALQGLLCCTSGVIIITQCHDLVYHSHWLTDTYVLIGTGYLVYDVWATYQCFIYDSSVLQQLPLMARIRKFIHNDPVMMFHHIGLPMVYFPVVMYFRGGVGDGLIGCFMMIEATVPFISFREILVILKMTRTWLYFINGVLTLFIYTLSRIAIFPWIFWMYGQQIGRPWYEVPFLLKPVCIAGTAVFLSLYVYWWFMILGIAKNEVKSWFFRDRCTTKEKDEDGNSLMTSTFEDTNSDGDAVQQTSLKTDLSDKMVKHTKIH